MTCDEVDAALHDDVQADARLAVLDVDLDALGERAAEEARQLADGRLLHGDDAVGGARRLAGELGDDLVSDGDAAREIGRREGDPRDRTTTRRGRPLRTPRRRGG